MNALKDGCEYYYNADGGKAGLLELSPKPRKQSKFNKMPAKPNNSLAHKPDERVSKNPPALRFTIPTNTY